MIHEFALEPELVASWHDPRVAYPFRAQMGPGQRRVACAFPFPAWGRLVMNALQASFADPKSPEAQSARKNIEVLLRHIQETGTRRRGRLMDGESWLDAAMREHHEFPFGGIVVRSSSVATPYLVVAERMHEQEFPAWTPPAPPVLRRPRELADALAPILRCATKLHFVDPYFDAADETFFAPMREYLLVAQNRRGLDELQIQVHFGVPPKAIEQASRDEGRPVTEVELARRKLEACEQRIRPLLRPMVNVRAFAWAEGPGGVKLHNRYLLTEVGGIAVQTGLDQSTRGGRQTDDLTVLSREQHEARRAEYCVGAKTYRLLGDSSFAGAPPAGG